jgi:hypothetical protein
MHIINVGVDRHTMTYHWYGVIQWFNSQQDMLRHRSSENASLEWIGCSGEPDKARHLSMESMILPWCTECTVVTDSHSFYTLLRWHCFVKLLRFIWSPNCTPNISRHIPGFRFAAAHVHEVSQPGDVKVVEAPLHNRIFLYFSILSRNRWNWVLRTLQFGYAGISHRFQVGKTSIILTRDKNYKLHAFYNSCSSQLWSTVQNTHCRHLCSCPGGSFRISIWFRDQDILPIIGTRLPAFRFGARSTTMVRLIRCRHRGARVCSSSTKGCKQLADASLHFVLLRVPTLHHQVSRQVSHQVSKYRGLAAPCSTCVTGCRHNP